MKQNISINEHGIFVGISRVGDVFLLKMKAVGVLTHNDYKVMIPVIENAIKGVEQPNIKVLFDATEFEGWEIRAAWDDFKFGVNHLNQFSKMAVVGHKKWHEYIVKIANWFMISSEVEYFSDLNKASAWIEEDHLKI